jgi:hypothetical protein
MKHLNMIAKTIALTAFLAISACTTGEDPGTGNNNTKLSTTPDSLNQAAFNGSTYAFGHNSIPNIAFTGAPADTDFSRSAMLHDGSTYRLYFFKQGSNDTLYQFGFNPGTLKYEFGYNSIDILKITGIPADADASSFAMLHDGSVYRLYMRSKTNAETMYQFGYHAATQAYEFGYSSIPVLYITMAPADIDHSRWAMLHDGSRYRLYIGKAGENDQMYQFAYNPASSDYEWGFNSISLLTVTGMPADSIKTNFTMLHDGSDYRFYYQAAQ